MFAALAGVPVFALPYAPKVTDFLDGVGMPPNARVTSESVGALLAAIDRTWDLREQIAADVSKHIGSLRLRSLRTVDVALDCLSRTTTRGHTSLTA
jgi:polysaccharide pyruvyl transferase WcaK-like protein